MLPVHIGSMLFMQAGRTGWVQAVLLRHAHWDASSDGKQPVPSAMPMDPDWHSRAHTGFNAHNFSSEYVQEMCVSAQPSKVLHLNIFNCLFYLLASGATEHRERPLARKLQLSLANFQQVGAALDKCVNMGKDGRQVMVPRPCRALGYCLGGAEIKHFPLSACGNGLLQRDGDSIHVGREDV
jgi:hypothetical protein